MRAVRILTSTRQETLLSMFVVAIVNRTGGFIDTGHYFLMYITILSTRKNLNTDNWTLANKKVK